ncbi:hypothetical protein BDW75DRAFT_200651 [Aspergillus navahoensis]
MLLFLLPIAELGQIRTLSAELLAESVPAGTVDPASTHAFGHPSAIIKLFDWMPLFIVSRGPACKLCLGLG